MAVIKGKALARTATCGGVIGNRPTSHYSLDAHCLSQLICAVTAKLRKHFLKNLPTEPLIHSYVSSPE